MEKTQLISKNNITGLILAGGEGRRVEGRDKGLLKYKGTSLIERQIAWLEPQVKSLLISANRNIEQYKKFEHLVLCDNTKHFEGPLRGVLRGLESCSTEFLFVQTVDVPHLPVNLVELLIDKMKSQKKKSLSCYYLKSNQREHYLSMLISKKCLHSLKDYLESGHRKVIDYHREIGSIALDLGVSELAFRNLNSSIDYQ